MHEMLQDQLRPDACNASRCSAGAKLHTLKGNAPADALKYPVWRQPVWTWTGTWAEVSHFPTLLEAFNERFGFDDRS